MKISTYKNEVNRHIHQLARVPPINVKGFPIYHESSTRNSGTQKKAKRKCMNQNIETMTKMDF